MAKAASGHVEHTARLEELQAWATGLSADELAEELRQLARCQGPTGHRPRHGPDARWALLCEAARRVQVDQ